MLSRQHFYHRITRKLVVAFGTMFNNIRLVRYNKAGTQEIERITVPLTYSEKEKFYVRITQDPNLNKEVMLTLPRMSFQLDSITYDPLRKVSSFQKFVTANTSSNNTVKTAYSAPYNFNFSLQIYVRNTEDGTQLIEQILPYFNPDYTVTIDLTDGTPPMDVPFILESVDYSLSGDTGTPMEMRMIVWTLQFTAKSYLFGPISNDKIIRKVTANTYYDDALTGVIGLDLTNGVGEYKVGEVVYEGRTLSSANSVGFVREWSNTSNVIVLEDFKGRLELGKKLRGAVSNATFTISTIDTGVNQLVNLTVEPNPLTANANDDFGFTQTIEEYPDIT